MDITKPFAKIDNFDKVENAVAQICQAIMDIGPENIHRKLPIGLVDLPSVLKGLVDSGYLNGDIVITGDLTVNGLITGTIAGFTAKSAIYADANGYLAEDIVNYIWDYINKRLGIGTNTPATSLDILRDPAGGSPWTGQVLMTPSSNDKESGFSIKTTRGSDRQWNVMCGSGNATHQESFRIYDATRGSDVINCDKTGLTRIGDADGNDYFTVEADGTPILEGEARAWDDIVTPVATGKVPAANYPGFNTLIGNIKCYQFSVNDHISLPPLELLHWYDEGTNFDAHLHWCSVSDVVSARYVKWELEWTVANMGNPTTTGVGSVFAAPTVATVEQAVPANTPVYTHMYTDITTIPASALTIGAVLQMRLRRITASGTAPSSDPFALNVGFHLVKDKFGSRDEYSN